jgi:hypothetical protein
VEEFAGGAEEFAGGAEEFAEGAEDFAGKVAVGILEVDVGKVEPRQLLLFEFEFLTSVIADAPPGQGI